MSSVSKRDKFIIWLENLDSYVQEGSNTPSLFDSERAAKRCAKELWPKTAWRIEQFSYIKKAEKRLRDYITKKYGRIDDKTYK